jgi:pimeloyl-ACP methyl ester carboxylesterase
VSRLLVAVVLLAGAACSSTGAKRAESAQTVTTTTAPTTTTTAPTTSTTAPAPAPTPAATVPPAPAPAPVTSPGGLRWTACGGLQCASLVVPRDYADPAGPTLTLALARKPARTPAARIGSLLINPGGPGDSGVDDLPAELRSLTATLQNRFDIVSWDPRGVERSAPVHCSDPKASSGTAGGAGGAGDSGPPLDPAPTTDAGRKALTDAYRAAGQACLQWSGDLLRHVGTDATVEDLERIRIALGEDKLTFIGHSAGTLLGAVYADRHPQHVRAFVLDGPIDPSLTLDQMTLAQAVGFEAALRSFFAWCDGTATCPWRPPDPDRTAAFNSLMDRIRQKPLTASGNRTVGVDTFVSGTMSRLTARSNWPSLGDALAAAERGDGSPLATLASNYQNAGASNAADARQSILCLDHPAPRDPDAYPALAEASKAQAPVFGPVFTWAALSCGVWPVPSTLTSGPTRAAGAPPILVVGTTGDPATPQGWARSLAGQFEHGVLVLRQGAEHVAYYYSACVRAIVDRYVVDGLLPASGTTCAS